MEFIDCHTISDFIQRTIESVCQLKSRINFLCILCFFLKCTTYNYEIKENGKVYDLQKYKNSKDKYDIYLSGPTSVIRIENPSANNDKELLLFRDSFGSSIAPLLIENYRKITLIDLRYINSELLTEYIEFNNQDVLFLYSGVVLNQNILKWFKKEYIEVSF